MKKNIALAGVALMLPATLLSTTAGIAFADVTTADRDTIAITADAASSTVKHPHAGRHSKKTHVARHKKSTRRDILGGVVRSVNGNSLLLAARTQTVTVRAEASTRVINRLGQPIALSAIQAGNRVAVLGLAEGSTIDARIIRDVSIPAVGAAK